jgi:HAMP domain-containing protein/predicted HD phosphohydrolase
VTSPRDAEARTIGDEMRAFNNLPHVLKLSIPISIMVLLTVGLVVFASWSILSLKENTRVVVAASARALTAANLSTAIDEATIQEKNIILETSAAEINRAHHLYLEAQTSSVALADRLIEMADTPERMEVNRRIKALLTTFFTMSAKAVDHGLKGERELATKVSDVEVRPSRRALVDLTNERVTQNNKALMESKDVAMRQADASILTLAIAAIVGLVIAVSLVAAIAIIGVSRPMQAMAAALGRLAAGDLAVRVEGAERRDEVGSLARSLEVFRDNAIAAQRLAAAQESGSLAKMRRAETLDRLTKRFETNVSSLTQGLAGAATEMEATARSMSATAETSVDQAAQVGTAAERTSANVQTVAAASEEMSASIQEIIAQVAQSSAMASSAVEDARHTESTVQRLAKVAERITDVVALINTIAGHTNRPTSLRSTRPSRRHGRAKPAAASPWWRRR